MLHKSVFPIEVLRTLPAEDAHAALEWLEGVRLENARQSKRYYENARELKEEYMVGRNTIVEQGSRDELYRLRKSQRNEFRSVKLELSKERTDIDRLYAIREGIEKNARKTIGSLGVNESVLNMLREAHQKKRELAFSETIGIGKTAGSVASSVDAEALDDEYSPPQFLYPWTEVEIEGNLDVRDWDDYRTGTIGGSILCSLRDEGDYVAKGATIRQAWVMGYGADRTGRMVATIDLRPSTLFSSVGVRDEFGTSAVSISRSFRVFAQLGLPGASRYYWDNNGDDQIISRGLGGSTWGGARNRLPFSYLEKGNLHSYNSSGDIESPASGHTFAGTSMEDGSWSYDILFPDTVRQGQAGFVVIGVEMSNRVWGDDCTVHNLIEYEFVTPRISWYVV